MPENKSLSTNEPLAVVEFLIEHGASMIKKDKRGCTPLQDAVHAEEIEIYQFLVEKEKKRNEDNKDQQECMDFLK